MNWTIGADVEIMLEKQGKLISAVPLFPSDQHADELPHGTVFHDNVLAEFTIKPASSYEEFARHILENVSAIEQALLKDNVKTRIVASARYPQSELESDQAKRFGCSPDYDAYELCHNEVTAEAHETDLRSAGGHIHFAHLIFADPYKVVEMVKLMDVFLGVPSIILDDTPESKERRVLYGKASAHRPKNYPGGEARILSNFWIKSSQLIKWAYSGTEHCLKSVLDNQTVVSLGLEEKEIQRIINEADIVAAKQLCLTLQDTVKYILLPTQK